MRPGRFRCTFVVILSAAAVAAGCGLVSFDVSSDIPPQMVQGNPLGALLPAGLFQVPMHVDLAAETKARGTGPAKSAHLSSLR